MENAPDSIRTRPPLRLALLAAFGAALTGGCDDGPTAPAASFDLPSDFVVEAVASGLVGARFISCSLDLRYEVVAGPVADGDVAVYRARAGGEAMRTVLDADGAGMSFSPLLFSPDDSVRVGPGGTLELITPINLTTDVAFYEKIGRLTGTLTGDGTGEGTWTCAPLRSEQDAGGSVEGTWTLRPVAEQPGAAPLRTAAAGSRRPPRPRPGPR